MSGKTLPEDAVLSSAIIHARGGGEEEAAFVEMGHGRGGARVFRACEVRI